MTRSGNLFAGLPAAAPPAEVVETLAQTGAVRIERIISWGHVTPAGEWFDQLTDEWVVLLAGVAHLCVEGERGPRELRSGDWVFLPARVRHRVEWTDPARPCVWLAVHAG